jgi:hypothetical protein
MEGIPVMIRTVFCAAAIALAGGCSQEVPFAAPAPAPAAPTVPTAPAAASLTDDCSAASQDASESPGDDVFAITLVDKPVCSSAPAATAVAKWNVSAANVAAVSIYVNSPGNPRKLWVDGTATGEQTTGPWVFENTCFSLLNKDTGRVLATRLVGAIPCAR